MAASMLTSIRETRCSSKALERAGRQSGEAVTRALERRAARGVSAFRALVEAYLGDEHLASLETGCPVAALACDMPRQSDAVREASAARVRRLVAGVQSALPHASRASGERGGRHARRHASARACPGRQRRRPRVALGGTQGARPAVRHTPHGGRLSRTAKEHRLPLPRPQI